VLFTIFINDTDDGSKYTLRNVAGDTKLSGAVNTLEGGKGPGQDGEVGPREPDEVQQGQVQGAALGSGQCQVLTQTGGRSPWEQACGEGLGGPGGRGAGHEPAVCARSPEANCVLGCIKKGWQQGEGGDRPPLLGSCEAPCAALRPGLGPPAQEGRGALGAGPEEALRWSEGWSSSAVRKG